MCNAFLFGSLDVPIFMEQPTDSSGIPAKPGYICRLLKSMYGIKQASNTWGSLFMVTITRWGFKKSSVDPCVFYLSEGIGFIILVIVVDDMLFASNSERLLSTFKSKLENTFDVIFFNSLSSFLGWEITRFPKGIFVSQRRYISEIVNRHGLQTTNGTLSPLSIFYDPHIADATLSVSQHALYRTIIGELLYLTVCTRPDLTYSVNLLARNVHAPTLSHMRTQVQRGLCVIL